MLVTLLFAKFMLSFLLYTEIISFRIIFELFSDYINQIVSISSQMSSENYGNEQKIGLFVLI